MLRQVFIVKGNDVLYKRTYGNALSDSEVEDLSFKLKREAMKKLGKAIGSYDYLKFRVSYIVEVNFDLIFIFVTGLMCNPKEFPNFAALLKHFKLYVLKTSELNETRTFYRKCLERIVAW